MEKIYRRRRNDVLWLGFSLFWRLSFLWRVFRVRLSNIQTEMVPVLEFLRSSGLKRAFIFFISINNRFIN